jgi:hypothetical protein
MIHSKKNKLNIINTKARHKWKKDALHESGRQFSIKFRHANDSDVRLALFAIVYCSAIKLINRNLNSSTSKHMINFPSV